MELMGSLGSSADAGIPAACAAARSAALFAAVVADDVEPLEVRGLCVCGARFNPVKLLGFFR